MELPLEAAALPYAGASVAVRVYSQVTAGCLKRLIAREMLMTGSMPGLRLGDYVMSAWGAVVLSRRACKRGGPAASRRARMRVFADAQVAAKLHWKAQLVNLSPPVQIAQSLSWEQRTSALIYIFLGFKVSLTLEQVHRGSLCELQCSYYCVLIRACGRF